MHRLLGELSPLLPDQFQLTGAIGALFRGHFQASHTVIQTLHHGTNRSLQVGLLHRIHIGLVLGWKHLETSGSQLWQLAFYEVTDPTRGDVATDL